MHPVFHEAAHAARSTLRQVQTVSKPPRRRQQSVGVQPALTTTADLRFPSCLSPDFASGNASGVFGHQLMGVRLYTSAVDNSVRLWDLRSLQVRARAGDYLDPAAPLSFTLSCRSRPNLSGTRILSERSVEQVPLLLDSRAPSALLAKQMHAAFEPPSDSHMLALVVGGCLWYPFLFPSR